MSKRKSFPASQSVTPGSDRAFAFEAAVRSLSRPWWATVAASVLLCAGAQQVKAGNSSSTVDSPATSVPRTIESVGNSFKETITVKDGGHLEVTGVTITGATTGTNQSILTLLGGQLSGSGIPTTPITYAGAVTIGDGVVQTVNLTLGNKGDTGQLILGGGVGSEVTLQQQTPPVGGGTVPDTAFNLTADSAVLINGLSNVVGNAMGSVVTINKGNGQITIQNVSEVGGKISFTVDGGDLKLAPAAANTQTGDTTLKSGKLTVNDAGLGTGTGKLILLGGELNALNVTKDTVIDTTQDHAVVKVDNGSALKKVQITGLKGATVVVDASPLPGAKVSITDDITGTASLEKSGKGILSVDGKIPDTFISDGVLAFTAAPAAGNPSAPTDKIHFQGGILDVSAGLADPSGNFAPVAAGQKVKIIAAAATTFETAISGQGGLELVSGNLTLAPVSGGVAVPNTYKGATLLDDSGTPGSTTLIVRKLDDIASSSSITIQKNAVLDAMSPVSSTSTFNPNQKIVILGNGQLRVSVGSATGVANAANIVVPLDSAPAVPLNKPVQILVGAPPAPITAAVTDLRLKVNVGDNANVKNLKVGESLTFVSTNATTTNKRLTVADFANGVVTPVDASPDQLTFEQPAVFKPVNGSNGLVVTRQNLSVFGKGKNGEAIGEYFSQHQDLPAGSHQLDGALNVLNTAMTGGEITNVLTQLSPAAYSELAHLQVRRAMAVTQSLEDRVDSLNVRSGAGTGPSLSMGVAQHAQKPTGTTPAAASSQDDSKWAVWASAYTNSARMGASDERGLGSVRENAVGDTFGVERSVGNAVIGLFGANGWGKTRFEDPSVDVRTDSWNIGLYTVVPVGDVTLDASVAYGSSENDARRHVSLASLPAANGEYHAKFDSHDLQVSAGVAYNLLEPDSSFQTAPVLRLSYVNVHQGGLEESAPNAAATPYAARVDKVDESAFFTKLGWKFAYHTGGKNVAFSADAASYWLHDWTTNAYTTQARLAGGAPGANLPITSRKGSADSVLLNGGVQVTLNERYTARLSINQEFAGDRNETIGRATVAVKF